MLIILCWFLPVININQPYVYTCPLLPESASHFPPCPNPLGCHRAQVASYSEFPLAIYFTYGNVYVSALLSIHPTLSFRYCVHMYVLYVYFSIAALQIGSLAPSSREGNGTPLQCSCLEKGQQSLVGCGLWGRTESDTTEAT